MRFADCALTGSCGTAGQHQQRMAEDLAVRLAALVRIARAAAHLRDIGQPQAALSCLGQSHAADRVRHSIAISDAPAPIHDLTAGPCNIWRMRINEVSSLIGVGKQQED